MNVKLIGSIGVLLLTGALAGCTPTAVAPAGQASAGHMGAPQFRPEKPEPGAVPVTYTTPPPLVQECGIVSISTPARYACRGKVYTSWQLLKMRTDYAKNGSWTAP